MTRDCNGNKIVRQICVCCCVVPKYRSIHILRKRTKKIFIMELYTRKRRSLLLEKKTTIEFLNQFGQPFMSANCRWINLSLCLFHFCLCFFLNIFTKCTDATNIKGSNKIITTQTV